MFIFSRVRNVDKQVIAESIEDYDTLDTLRQLGVDFGQGYYLSRPEAIYEHVLLHKPGYMIIDPRTYSEM